MQRDRQISLYVTGKENATADQTPARIQRPRNTYLKILMDESVFVELHCLMQQIKDSWENNITATKSSEVDEFRALSTVSSDAAFPPSVDEPHNDRAQIIDQQTNSYQPKLEFRTRSLQSLHITYFFCGTMLNEMSADQLDLLNSMLHERLQNVDNKDNSYFLTFKSIELFPPQRQNLIAATFESSPALDKLYEDLCDIAMTPKNDTEQQQDDKDKHTVAQYEKEYEFPLLRSAVFKDTKKRRQVQSSKNDTRSPWLAHVTLSNIVGGKKNHGVKQLGEWLNQKQFQDVNTGLNKSEISVEGLSLGGPYPQQIDLDWNFPFSFNFEQTLKK
jgi:hypothetical protein